MKYLFLFLLFSVSAFAKVSPDDVLGVWWSPEQKSKVEIYKNGDKYIGRLIAIRPESKDKLDSKNENKKKRGEKLLGLEILKNFQFKEDRWTGGTIYDPENGKTYKSIMWMSENIKDQLQVRGYVGFALLGRTAEFKKVSGDTPNQQQANEPIKYYGD